MDSWHENHSWPDFGENGSESTPPVHQILYMCVSLRIYVFSHNPMFFVQLELNPWKINKKQILKCLVNPVGLMEIEQIIPGPRASQEALLWCGLASFQRAGWHVERSTN